MSESNIQFLTILAATGSGLVTGIFFAFSVFLMRALAELPAIEGMKAMQKINTTIITPLFLLVFAGTGVLSAALLLLALFDPPDTGRWNLVAGSLNYLIGALLVTSVFNIPRNNLLASLDESPGSQVAWRQYIDEWTIANHLRTALTTVATVMLILSLI